MLCKIKTDEITVSIAIENPLEAKECWVISYRSAILTDEEIITVCSLLLRLLKIHVYHIISLLFKCTMCNRTLGQIAPCSTIQ